MGPLEIRGITKRYGDVVAVDDLTLEVGAGELLMSVRMATGDATAWQVGLAIVLIVVSIVGLIWLAGRIYANSILRLGVRVRLLDAIRATRR